MKRDDSIPSTNGNGGRRSFLVRLAAVVIGALVFLFPFLTALGIVFSPLRRRRTADRSDDPPGGPDLVRIGPLAMLPGDGVPRQFVVTSDVVDAWTRIADRRIGSVFLTRTDEAGKPRVTALSAMCPHLGCVVDYVAEAGEFECPCHDAFFAKDGALLAGPGPRGLDPLPVEILQRNGEQEIWIGFQQFRTGVAERIPVA